jgi:signal transduction histidine kinase/DNA-binding response OmpR family regulator/ligand-binding sensor domain-containing protein
MPRNVHKVLTAIGLYLAAMGTLCGQDQSIQSSYRFQHYNTQNGLPNDLYFSSITDSLGYVWTYNFGSLTRYDGYKFKVFKYDEQDPTRNGLDFNIGRLWTDATGNIWLAQVLNQFVNPFTLVRYDWKTDRFVKYPFNVKGGTSHFTYSFEQDNKRVWAAKADHSGIVSLDFTTGEVEEFILPPPEEVKEIAGSSVVFNYYNAKIDPRNSVTALHNYDTSLLVGSTRGLWLFGKKSKKFSRPPCKPEDQQIFYQSWIPWFLKPKNEAKNSIWFRTTSGLMIKIDSNFSVVHRTDKVMSGLAGINTDDESVWFSHLDSGLYRYKLRDSTLTNIRTVTGDPYSLQSNSILGIHIDRDMTVWIVYWEQGISRLTKKIVEYQNIRMPIQGATSSQPGVHSSFIYEVGGKEYLILNHGKKIIMGDIGAGPDARIEFQEFLPAIKEHLVSGLWKGSKYLWISIASDGGVVGYPINSETSMPEVATPVRMWHDPANANTIAANMANDVWESASGDLWIAHVNQGISRVKTNVPYGNDGSVIRYRHIESDSNSLITDRAWSFFPEDDGSVWVLTWDGVDLVHFDGQNVLFEHVFSNRGVPNVLFRTSHDQLFLGTRSGLYLATKENGRYHFNFQTIVGKKSISGIQEDEFGRLWLKGTGTLTYFDLIENTVLELNEQDGMDHLRSMSYANLEPHHGIHRSKNGMLIVVDPNGLTLLDPKTFSIDRRPVMPLLTDLLINNRSPQIGGHPSDQVDYVVPAHISALSELVIDYQHNNFIIEFAALQMTAPEKNRYSHKLEGYDNSWLETDYTNRTATYTNLPAGTYTFRVKASNHLGIWSDQERTLKVIILPPPWKTWWAYSLYGIMIVGLLFSWRQYDSRRLKLKHRAEHLGELDTLKTQFFTNISHEFRTPITLLLSPLKEMYNKAVDTADKDTIGTMLRNGQRLSGLINQLLDISKLEAGKMPLRASALNVIRLIREICSSYESAAADKNIKFTFYPEVKELNAFVDQEKLETIMHNLLSNAFKFTLEGGGVLVHVKLQHQKRYQIIVKDTGIGIPAGQLEKVFDRFYQVDNSKTRNFEGSGLGMALAKELVELHHGKIAVESEHGSGSAFTVTLPIGKENFAPGELMTDGMQQVGTRPALLGASIELNDQGDKEVVLNGELPLLLIVEDNSDMRNFIKRILGESHQIIESANGQEGLDKALREIPDFIISDVMMPVMDGYALCAKIKSNELTSHIPVILLTAKADQDSKISGLEVGADDYLLKPFDAEELRLLVRNRMATIQKTRDRFSREVMLEPRKIAITSLDERFVNKVMEVIELHMAEELFSIDDLAKEVGYSHMQLYRKIKALAGQSPSVFVRTIRLKRAAALLEKDSDNVTQIAYSVGFSSLSYFTKCFKEQYGITPGQYPPRT